MLTKQMREFERLAKMQDEVLKRNTVDYEPMFPEGWADDKNWPVSNYDYESFRKHQIEIDYQLERMVGCYD